MKKICKICSKKLNHSNCYIGKQRGKNGQIWDYLDSCCKKCRLEYATNRRKDIRRQAISYLGGKCMKCGLISNNPVVYDFHHRNPKEKDFTISGQGKCFDTIKPELDKCDLLCAICHRLVHDALSS